MIVITAKVTNVIVFMVAMEYIYYIRITCTHIQVEICIHIFYCFDVVHQWHLLDSIALLGLLRFLQGAATLAFVLCYVYRIVTCQEQIPVLGSNRSDYLHCWDYERFLYKNSVSSLYFLLAWLSIEMRLSYFQIIHNV